MTGMPSTASASFNACKIGSMYASVLPEPVCDATAKSLCRSWMSVGMTMLWISVASWKPSE